MEAVFSLRYANKGEPRIRKRYLNNEKYRSISNSHSNAVPNTKRNPIKLLDNSSIQFLKPVFRVIQAIKSEAVCPK